MQKIKFVNNIVEDLVIIEDVIREIEKEKEFYIVSQCVSDEVIDLIKSKTESMRTFSEQKKILLRKQIDDEYKKKLSVYDEYKELVIVPYEKDYDKETESLRCKFQNRGDKVEQIYFPEFDLIKVRKSINDNKKILSETDYIIIKYYEAKLSMSDAPYTQEYLDEVINKRQIARDKINKLESLLKQ